MSLMRLDKYICDMGLATRREIKQLIREGRVAVNGSADVKCDMKLDPQSTQVALDGRVLQYCLHHYYMMDKPAGVLSATEDGKQGTVLDLLPPEIRRMGVFPVGRLDKDTTGLLLITDDGDFAHRVISPKSEISKLYLAKVDGIPDETDVAAFRQGLVLKDGTHCLPAELTITGKDECLVRVMEGKYHQVKRMLASRGKPVVQLRRLSVGGLVLDKMLGCGGFRELSEDELCIVMRKK